MLQTFSPRHWVSHRFRDMLSRCLWHEESRGIYCVWNMTPINCYPLHIVRVIATGMLTGLGLIKAGAGPAVQIPGVRLVDD